MPSGRVLPRRIAIAVQPTEWSPLGLPAESLVRERHGKRVLLKTWRIHRLSGLATGPE